jgi:hypothetical protein
MRSRSALSDLRRTSVARLCAVWLVALAAVPFTAPFAALNWSDFVHSGRTPHVLSIGDTPVASSAQDDEADDAAASDACAQRVHSYRYCELAPVASPVAGDPLASAVPVVSRVTADLSARGASALATILRL